MATRIILLLILAVTLSTTPILSFPRPLISSEPQNSYSYIHYKRAEDHRYRSSLVSFLHRQPDGSQLATTRYYRIVFHCNILPGSLYLRFSKLQPYRTVVQNRQDPSTIFAFRSVGAYSRVQIQHHATGRWLCMNKRGTIVTKPSTAFNNLACIFRQNSDGLYMNLVSELDSSRSMSFNTLHLLSMNPILRHHYGQFTTNENQVLKREQCSRFLLDSQIDTGLLNKTTDPFFRLRQ